MSTSILLFAAGLGTRMGDMVKDKPKPLINVAGKTLLDHALDFTVLNGVGTRMVNLHYFGDAIREHLAGRDIVISDESDKLLETGGGLKKALPLLISNPVLTMNTDAVWRGPTPLAQIMNAWEDHMEALLLVVPKSRAYGHQGSGDFTIHPDGQLIRGSETIYTGLQMVRTDTLEAITADKFSMNILWNEISSRSSLYGTTYDGHWCDVGQPSSIPIAENMLNV